MPYDPDRHGPRRVVGPGFHARVFEAVREVPEGAVTTYGDVATRLGLATAARHVGYALASVPPEERDLPWHRVVNGQGRVSARGEGGGPSREQIERLRSEGVEVTASGRVREFRSLRWRFL